MKARVEHERLVATEVRSRRVACSRPARVQRCAQEINDLERKLVRFSQRVNEYISRLHSEHATALAQLSESFDVRRAAGADSAACMSMRAMGVNASSQARSREKADSEDRAIRAAVQVCVCACFRACVRMTTCLRLMDGVRLLLRR